MENLTRLATETKTQRAGRLLVISGPSGVGKDTVMKAFVAANPSFKYSISYTTRNPGEGEVNGVSYFFVDDNKFKDLIKKNEFVEWASVHGKYYGTSKSQVEGALQKGQDMALILDVQGAAQLKKVMPYGTYVFLLPPSMALLKTRLIERNREGIEAINQRLETAKEEIKQAPKYDYQLVNDYIDVVVERIGKIMKEQLQAKEINVL